MAQIDSTIPNSRLSINVPGQPFEDQAQIDGNSTLNSTGANTPPKEVDGPQDEDANNKPSQKEGGPPPAMNDPSQFPDGGFTAWFCVAGGFCCAFCSFGWVNGEALTTCTTLFNEENADMSRYSHRRLPRILRERSACFVYTVGNIVDCVTRNILHVLRSAYSRESL